MELTDKTAAPYAQALFSQRWRDATEGRLPLQVQNTELKELRAEMRRINSRRDAALGAAVLWVSGLIWLAVSTQIPWLGWTQMTAAIFLFVWSQSSRRRTE